MTTPPRGSAGLVEEALRLIETLQVISDEHVSGASGHLHVGETPEPSGSSGPAGSSESAGSSEPAGLAGEARQAAECRVCPVCRLIVAFRHLRPEVTAHLASAAEELLAAAREFAASSTPPASPFQPTPSQSAQSAQSSQPSQSAQPSDPGASPSRRPQRIPLD